MRRSTRWAWAAASVLLVVIGVVRHAPVLVGRTSATLAQEDGAVWPWRADGGPLPFEHVTSDQAESVHPGWVQIDAAMDDGDLPSWNPWSFGGTPSWSNGLGVVAYPPRWVLSQVAGPLGAHDLFLLGHQIAAGLAMLGLLASVGRRPAPAFLGSLAYMLSAAVEGWAQLELFLPPAVLLPAAMAASDRFVVTRRTVWIGAWGIAIALLLTGTGIGVGVIAVAVAGMWWLRGTLAGSRTIRAWPRAVAPAAWAAALGVALAAPVLLPTLALVGVGTRSVAPFEQYDDVARTLGTTLLDVVQRPDPPIDGGDIHSLVFLGIPILALMAIGATTRLRGARFGVALAAVVVATATLPAARFVSYHLLPFTQPTQPGRVTFLVPLGAALALSAGAALVAERWPRRPLVPLGAAALATYLTVGGITAGRDLNPPYLERSTEMLGTTPLLEALAHLQGEAEANGDSLLVLGAAATAAEPPPLIASLPSLHDLRAANGYESLMVRRNADRWRVVEGMDPDAARLPSSSAYRNGNPLPALNLDAAVRSGVDTLVTPPGVDVHAANASGPALRLAYDGPDGRIWLLEDARPAAFLADDVRTVADDVASLRSLPDPAPPGSATIEAADADDVPACSGGSSDVRVQIGRDEIEAQVLDGGGGLLVFAVAWAPGWHATADGEAATVLPADHANLAVAVPCGTRNVQLRYAPPGRRVGAAVAGAAGVVLLAAVAHDERRRRAGREPGASDDGAGGTDQRTGAADA